MTLDRAEWHCTNWARWMRTGGTAQLKVKIASLEGRYQATDTEDLYDRSDQVAARATDAVLADIALRYPIVTEAVHSVYLGKAWAGALSVEAFVQQAYALVAIGLERRSIV